MLLHRTESKFKQIFKQSVTLLTILIFIALIILLTFNIVKTRYNNSSEEKYDVNVLNEDITKSIILWPNVFGKTFISADNIHDNYLYLKCSKNDTYRVEFLNNQNIIDYIIINSDITVTTKTHSFLYFIPDHITEEGYDTINISPINGDGNYHIYELKTLNNPDFNDYDVDTIVDFKIDKIEIEISDKNLEKINANRKEAIELGINISDGIYMPATAIVDGEQFKTELRLKGDWTDHMRGTKWSFRIKVKKDCIWGMDEFSIQPQESRNGIGEYLIQELYRDVGGVALRYNFVDVIINGAYMGVYAVEEGFDKRLVENSLKREGVIIKPNENLLWESWAYYYPSSVSSLRETNYTPFSLNKTLEDDVLRNYASYAIHNLNSFFTTRNFSFTEVFDAQMYASYLAVMDVFKAHHGTTWHNMRYYFNPITGLLEPIAFDEIYNSSGSYLYNYQKNVIAFLEKDETLKKLYFNTLYEYVENFDEFIKSEQNNIDKFNYILSRDGYSEFVVDISYDQERLDFLRKYAERQGVTID